ncbi:MAG: transposase [Verrucomicrobia bacterium]|nr:transposase [Verrucomicrobiota bacterium]
MPDESTICRFRQRLIDCGLHEQLLICSTRNSKPAATSSNAPPLVDATLIQSSRKRPDAQAARTAGSDADARYTRKYSQSYYGYKAHVSSDGEHQLVRTAHISAANANDADLLPRVVPADAGSLYADKAYDTKVSHAWLRERGIDSQIAKKGAHHIKLTEADRAENRRKSRVRGGIERIFVDFRRTPRPLPLLFQNILFAEISVGVETHLTPLSQGSSCLATLG